MNVDTNKELVEHLRSNEPGAFNDLYWKYHAVIYYNSLKLVKETCAAEDIVQEVFISLWEKRQTLDPELDIAGWLFVVSYNKSVTYLKHKLRQSMAQTYQLLPEAESPEVENLYIARSNMLEKAVGELSPQKRKVFELCKLQRKTYEEAAIELKLSKHTVKEYLSGAVVSIKEFVKQHPEHSAILIYLIIFEHFSN